MFRKMILGLMMLAAMAAADAAISGQAGGFLNNAALACADEAC